MSGPFKMRSGNSTPFKMMGSSPVKKAGCGPGDECAGNFKVNKKGTRLSRWVKSTWNRATASSKSKKSNSPKPKNYYDSDGGSHKTPRYL